MAAGRHRREPRHPARRLLIRLAAPALVVAAGAAVAVVHGVPGTSGSRSETVDLSVAAGAVTPPRADQLNRERLRAVSRSASRNAVSKPVTLQPRATGHRWATADLNVWTGPGEQGPRLGLVKARTRLAVTGQTAGHWAEVLLQGNRVRWVNADYLARHKPAPPADTSGGSSGAGATTGGTTGATTSGISTAPCPDGSATEAGLTSSAVRLYRAVCAAFPALTTYGGYDAHGEHASGRAIDFMISDPALGQAVANWVQAHAAELDIYDVIWQQHIWTPVRASEGWRFMPDRGSATANHYDHVHVSVN
jgi:hypothetical protein